jgi:DNA-binding NarL/FixJ family response regulator
MLSLIVARSRAMQEALTTILASVSQIEIVGVAENSLTALEMMRLHQPLLVIVDDDLPNGETSLAFINELRKNWSTTRILILADGTQQKQILMDNGADAVLLRGVPTEQITETINGLRVDKA